MSKVIKNILEVIKWVVLLGAFSAMGLMADNPAAGFFRYLIFFIVVFIGVFVYNKKKGRKTESNPVLRYYSNKVIGVILLALSVLIPFFFMKASNFPAYIYLLLGLAVLVLIAISIFAINLINSAKEKGLIFGIAGYVIIIVLCSLPAVLMMQYDRTYNALGTAYYMAFVITLFSWWGVSLFFHKPKQDTGLTD